MLAHGRSSKGSSLITVGALLLSAATTLAAEEQPPQFVDVSTESGFFGMNSTWASAWADYDGDGDLDVMTAGHLQEVTDSIAQLWSNNGDGTFSDVTIEAGGTHITGDTHGLAWSDLDNDGDPDLFILNGSTKRDPIHNNRLWRNNGDGTFTDVAETAGVIGELSRGRGTAVVDFDRDGLLDIFAVGFVRNSNDLGNLLFHNGGNLSFTDIAPAAGVNRREDENRSVAWADYDNDGHPDFVIMNTCAMFRNQGDGTFAEVTANAGFDDSESCTTAAWGDYDHDGFLDLYLSRGFKEPAADILYHNNGDGTFTDVTAAAGIDNLAHTRAATWGDYDNDGDLDVYVVNFSNPALPNRLYQNEGDGTFTDVALEAGVSAMVAGRGADGSFVDYDSDGFLDLFITNGEGNSIGPYVLLKNTGNENHWLEIALRGRASNSDGLMAKVAVSTGLGRRYHTHTGPSHFLSQSLTPLHIGTGQETEIESLAITWPSGEEQVLEGIAVDQKITVVEGQSIWAGEPTLSNSGFYVWRAGNNWSIYWIGEPGGTSFTGEVMTDGTFTSVTPIDFESEDSVVWSGGTIDFSAMDDGTRYDGIEFETIGETVTIDVYRDGVAQPQEVYLGEFGVRPAHLPLTLESERVLTFRNVSAAAGFYGGPGSWGAAWGDYDNDGDMDVATIGHLQVPLGGKNQLWRNNGDATFTDVTTEVGMISDKIDTHGIGWSDFDNDGDLDLLSVNEPIEDRPHLWNELWRNDGDGTFTDIALDAGISIWDRITRGLGMTDYDLDGFVDVFIAVWGTRNPDQLYRNLGNLTFEDVSVAAGLGEIETGTRTAAWGDFNDDGYPDLIVMAPCRLYMNQQDGTFIEVTEGSGIEISEECTSAAWSDYDDDGDLDLYVSRGFQRKWQDALYRNNGNGAFTDVTAASGIDNFSLTRSCTWGDYDNDGDEDLYVVNFRTATSVIGNRLYRNNGDGTFTDVAPELNAEAIVDGGGADGSFVDYDNNGFLDLFITNGEGITTGPYVLLSNSGNENHWLELNLRGRTSSRDAISTRVTVDTAQTKRYYTYTGPSHFMSQSITPVHIGMGSETGVERLGVRWPSGVKQRLENIGVDQRVTLVEAQPIWAKTPARVEELGYHVWNEQGTWTIVWIGDRATTNDFSGSITTNGQITSVSPLGFDDEDSLSWTADGIEFSAYDDGLPSGALPSSNDRHYEGIEFETTGGGVVFDIVVEGAAQPEVVHIGEYAVKPATLPLTLGARN